MNSSRLAAKMVNLEEFMTTTHGRGRPSSHDATGAPPHRRNTAMPPYSLTRRELEVLHQLLEGKTSLEAAAVLKVTVTVIETRLGSVRTKMGVRSTTEAAVKAIKEHLFGGMMPEAKSA
jgi:DNA-binding NarL/FixJ family response regulator